MQYIITIVAGITLALYGMSYYNHTQAELIEAQARMIEAQARADALRIEAEAAKTQALALLILAVGGTGIGSILAIALVVYVVRSPQRHQLVERQIYILGPGATRRDFWVALSETKQKLLDK